MHFSIFIYVVHHNTYDVCARAIFNQVLSSHLIECVVLFSLINRSKHYNFEFDLIPFEKDRPAAISNSILIWCVVFLSSLSFFQFILKNFKLITQVRNIEFIFGLIFECGRNVNLIMDCLQKKMVNFSIPFSAQCF